MFRRSILLLALGCGGPPDGAELRLDATSTADSSILPTDGSAATDASLRDAIPDAAGCRVDERAGDNPYGIVLVDVTSGVGEYSAARAYGDFWSFGAGVALVDLEPDGDLDVILARPDLADPERAGGPALLLRNEGANEVLAELVPDDAFSALTTGHEIHGVAAGDVDRDGDADLFLAAVGRDLFLRNDGGGFVDATAVAGLGGPIEDRTSQGVFADFNGDGSLDLFVVAQAPTWLPEPDWRMGNRLYLNVGDGTFREVTAEAGGAVAGMGSTHTAVVADLDGDRGLEIYVVNDRFSADGVGGEEDLDLDQILDPSESLDELGRPFYVDRADTLGLPGNRSAMGAALGDVDHDGDDDLYVTDIGRNHMQVWDAERPGFVDDEDLYGLQLRDNGTENHMYVAWGARFLDLDRDGWLELFLVHGGFSYTGFCLAEATQRDLYLRSSGPGAYVDITGLVGGLPGMDLCPPPEDYPQSGRGVVTGDLDGDGDDDLVVSPYAEPYRFYRNDTPACPGWRLRVRPRGTVSAPVPIGTVLVVELADGRTIRRTLYGGGDTYSQSDTVLEVGLRGTSIARADVHWPSGIAQRIDQLPGFELDRELVILEPDWLHLNDRTLEFPGATEIVYRPVDDQGSPLGATAAGRTVTMTRSDGNAITVRDMTDGSYRGTVVHMGYPRPVLVTISDGGVELSAHRVIEML